MGGVQRLFSPFIASVLHGALRFPNLESTAFARVLISGVALMLHIALRAGLLVLHRAPPYGVQRATGTQAMHISKPCSFLRGSVYQAVLNRLFPLP